MNIKWINLAILLTLVLALLAPTHPSCAYNGTITPQCERILDQAAQQLQANPLLTVKMIGGDDSTGEYLAQTIDANRISEEASSNGRLTLVIQ